MVGSEVPKGLYLTPAVAEELQWLAAEGPPVLARHARIVLGLSKGMSVGSVAASVAVHTNTVRNCQRRFEAQGLKGLGHRGIGKPKNQAFTEAVRDEVARVAMHSPANVGEKFERWSLRSLQAHLLRRGVVQKISVEGLRQQLRGLPLPAIYWRRTVRPSTVVPVEVLRALESLRDSARADRRVRAQIVLAGTQGLNEAEIAAALHLGRATVRRWLRRFRRHGILGLETTPRTQSIGLKIRRQIASLAAASPRAYGVDRDDWTIPILRQVLVRNGIVPKISLGQLEKILADVALVASPSSPAFGETAAALAAGASCGPLR